MTKTNKNLESLGQRVTGIDRDHVIVNECESVDQFQAAYRQRQTRVHNLRAAGYIASRNFRASLEVPETFWSPAAPSFAAWS